MFEREGNVGLVKIYVFIVLDETKLVYFSGQCSVLCGTVDIFSSDLILSVKSLPILLPVNTCLYAKVLSYHAVQFSSTLIFGSTASS